MRNCSIVLVVSLLAFLGGDGVHSPSASAAVINPASGRGINPVPTCYSDTLTILFTGDILLDRGVRYYLEHGGMRRIIPDETADFLRSADVVVGNLECPATTVQAPAFKRYVFRGDPQWLDSLRAYGFTHLNLANNHSVDQGRQGLRDTRLNILKAGLIPIGADSTMQAAATAITLMKTLPQKTLPLETHPPAPPCMEGSRYSSCRNIICRQKHITPLHTGRGRGEGLLEEGLQGSVYLLASNRLPLESFAYLPDRESVSQEPFDSLLNRVKAIKMADSIAVVIVNLHWGAEHTLRPLPQQRLEAHALIDAGADVIIGHHTHTLQTSETYRGKPIFYSIGNFIFDQQRPLNTEACIVRLRITHNKIEADAIPIRIDHCAPHICRNKRSSSFNFGNDIANGTESACKASTTQPWAEPWEMERHKRKLRPIGAESSNVS